jgi:hypothetical protein
MWLLVKLLDHEPLQTSFKKWARYRVSSCSCSRSLDSGDKNAAFVILLLSFLLRTTALVVFMTGQARKRNKQFNNKRSSNDSNRQESGLSIVRSNSSSVLQYRMSSWILLPGVHPHTYLVIRSSCRRTSYCTILYCTSSGYRDRMRRNCKRAVSRWIDRGSHMVVLSRATGLFARTPPPPSNLSPCTPYSKDIRYPLANPLDG